MALWKPLRGSRADLEAVPKQDGYVYFCDDGTLFFDYADANGIVQRKQINKDYVEHLLNITNNVGYIDAGKIIEKGVDESGSV